MPEDSDQEGAAPSEAFALIGNEIRAAILEELGKDPHTGLSFSELRSRVDEDMDSGQFNYHLDQLVGQFVDDGDDGYTLRQQGLSLYRAIQAGSFNREVTHDSFDAGFDCYFCATRVEAFYADGAFQLQCPDCDHVYSYTTVPPSAVEGVDEATLLDRIAQYNRHTMWAHAHRVCPICANGTTSEFISGEEAWTAGSHRLDVFYHTHCDHCGNNHYMSVGLALLFHPALVSFFYERGRDVTTTPHWHFEFGMTDDFTAVRSTDPWEVAVTVTADGDELELVVDDDLTVIEENRS
jgi:hypothetical protein